MHRLDVKTIKTFELGRKTFKTTQNYKRNQITMNCIDLASERSKMLRYVAKLQKWSYYDEFASIWRQNDHNNAKLRKWSNYNALHQFAVKTILNVEIRRKTTKGIKLRSICINLTSKTIKNVEARRKTFKTT